MIKHYLKPQTCIFAVRTAALVCASADFTSEGGSSEQFNEPQDWGGEWN